MGHSRPLFSLLSSFQFSLFNTVTELADDWIRTADLWCQEQRLYQLRHSRCPKSQSIFSRFSHDATELPLYVAITTSIVFDANLHIMNNHLPAYLPTYLPAYLPTYLPIINAHTSEARWTPTRIL